MQKVPGSASLNFLNPSLSSILTVPLMKLDLSLKSLISCSGTKITHSGLSLLSQVLENRSLSWDTLGCVNTIQKSTGQLEKSRCQGVLLDAVLDAEMRPVKSALPAKLKSAGKRLVLVVLLLSSTMTLRIPRIPTIPQVGGNVLIKVIGFLRLVSSLPAHMRIFGLPLLSLLV